MHVQHTVIFQKQFFKKIHSRLHLDLFFKLLNLLKQKNYIPEIYSLSCGIVGRAFAKLVYIFLVCKTQAMKYLHYKTT